MLRLILVSLAVLLASAAATDVNRCKNNKPFPLSVDVDGCESMPCDAIKGSISLMKVHFLGTKDNIKKLTARVRATALGITAPYVLPDDVADVCRNLLYGAYCPIDESEDAVYNFRFYIDPSYPEIPVKVEVSLVDQEKDTITCFIVNVRVKKGQQQISHL